MPVVVFLKGVNVGGHRRLRPSALAKALHRLDVVSIGAAGTFVVRTPVARAQLRSDIARRVPFEIEVAICSGNEILRLVADEPFAGEAEARDIVSFVGVMTARGRASSPVPRQFPAGGDWCVRVLKREGRFVIGQYRRQMKAISYLGQLERSLGAPLAVRNWSTILAIERALAR